MSVKTLHGNQDGTTTVMVRVLKQDGGIITVFPCEPRREGRHYEAWSERDGWHTVDIGIMKRTVIASESRAAIVVADLERQMGRKLRPVQRITEEMREVFNTRVEQSE